MHRLPGLRSSLPAGGTSVCRRDGRSFLPTEHAAGQENGPLASTASSGQASRCGRCTGHDRASGAASPARLGAQPSPRAGDQPEVCKAANKRVIGWGPEAEAAPAPQWRQAVATSALSGGPWQPLCPHCWRKRTPPRARRNLIALLATLPQALLVATHDMRLVWALCPRTVILDQGRIVADGPTTTLLRDQMLMEQHGLETPPEALLA